MVEFLEQGMTHHVAQELSAADDSSIETRLERAFLMADIHGHQAGVQTSGATVAICLVKVRNETFLCETRPLAYVSLSLSFRLNHFNRDHAKTPTRLTW